MCVVHLHFLDCRGEVHMCVVHHFLGVAVEGFAKLAENEDFGPIWKDFFHSKEELEDFLKLEPILEGILKRYPDKKAEMRPLTDFFKKVKKHSATM